MYISRLGWDSGLCVCIVAARLTTSTGDHMSFFFDVMALVACPRPGQARPNSELSLDTLEVAGRHNGGVFLFLYLPPGPDPYGA